MLATERSLSPCGHAHKTRNRHRSGFCAPHETCGDDSSSDTLLAGVSRDHVEPRELVRAIPGASLLTRVAHHAPPPAHAKQAARPRACARQTPAADRSL